jgi:hypothetical protein
MSSSIDWNLEYTKTITREQSYKTFDCGNFLPLHNYTIILCFKTIWLQLLPFNGSKLPYYCYITQNGSITLTTVSNTMVIYCRILTLERVSTTVNYCDIVYSIGTVYFWHPFWLQLGLLRPESLCWSNIIQKLSAVPRISVGYWLAFLHDC